MKKVITVLFLIFQFVCYCQQKESPKKFEYSELFTLTIDKGKSIETTYILWVDSDKESSEIKDSNGQPIKFKNDVVALCYLGKLGWELIEMYKEPGVLSSKQEKHYLLKRIIDDK